MTEIATTAGVVGRRRAGAIVTLAVIALMVATLTPSAQAVVGGREATPGANPYVAALVSSSNPDAFQGRFCGATVIAPQWVMTAGHCVLNATPAEIDVVIGRHDLSVVEGERIGVTSIVVHPAYTKKRSNDIALLMLESPSTAQPVGLATPANTALWAPGTVATVKGWGNTESVPRLPTKLREADLPITSDAACAPTLGAKFVAGTMICAGEIPNDATGPCQGDSGGPLVVPDGAGSVIQVGIVSWGGCDVPQAPAAFSEVAVFDTWIAAVMSNPPPDDPPDDPPPTDPPPGGQQLMVSTSADRSNPVPLQGASVSGNVFIFLSPPTGVDVATFTVPGYGEKTDSAAPFDAVGTGPEGNAQPVRTDRMPLGENTLSTYIVFTDGSSTTVSATFTNGAPTTTTEPPTTTTEPPTTTTEPPTTTTTLPPTSSDHQLLVSLSTDRSDPSPLQGATVGGGNTFFVFLAPDTGITQVSFALPGYGTKTDTATPFDAAGTGPTGNAFPLRKDRMPAGENTIVATITFSDGSTATTSATFTLP